MRYQLCTVAGVLGLLQIGQHFRDAEILDTLQEFRKRRYNSSNFPSDLDNCRAEGWWPKPILQRLSKWVDYAGSGEALMRDFTRQVFRHSGELGAVMHRMLDKENKPLPGADQEFDRWARSVIQAWGGRVHDPIPSFPDLAAARQYFVNNP